VTSLADTLINRASHAVSSLEEPAPDAAQVEELVRCALSAPDHGKLRPWKFRVLAGDARQLLADSLIAAAKLKDSQLSQEQLDALGSKPFRAPMIIACVTEVTEGFEKVPVFEQILSTGAAIQQLQLAANARGFGCCWLTGPHANSAPVKTLLGAAEKDLVAGFIYIGTPKVDAPQKPRPPVDVHLSYL